MKSQFGRISAVVLAVLMVALSGCTKNEPEGNTGNDAAGKAYRVEVPFEDKVSVFSFDDNGRIISQTNPGKSVDMANVAENADAAVIKYEYDENGRKIKASHYDTQNTKIAEKTYEYDSDGKCIKCDVYTTAEGELAFSFGFTYEYNSNGDISKITDDKGMIEEYLYNENGLCVKESVCSDGELTIETDFYYDDSDRLIKTESTSKDNCEYEYDSNGRLVKEVYDWYVVEYEYADNDTAKVYVTYEGQEKAALKLIEYFDNKRIIKESWYNIGSESEFYAISISLAEDITENEPNPQYTVNLK